MRSVQLRGNHNVPCSQKFSLRLLGRLFECLCVIVVVFAILMTYRVPRSVQDAAEDAFLSSMLLRNMTKRWLDSIRELYRLRYIMF